MPYLFLFLAGTVVSLLMAAYLVLVGRTMQREKASYERDDRAQGGA
mgnify:CR=1 FL=1